MATSLCEVFVLLKASLYFAELAQWGLHRAAL